MSKIFSEDRRPLGALPQCTAGADAPPCAAGKGDKTSSRPARTAQGLQGSGRHAQLFALLRAPADPQGYAPAPAAPAPRPAAPCTQEFLSEATQSFAPLPATTPSGKSVTTPATTAAKRGSKDVQGAQAQAAVPHAPRPEQSLGKGILKRLYPRKIARAARSQAG